MHYTWNVPRDVSDDKSYYIVASGNDDRSKVDISQPFKISSNKNTKGGDGGSGNTATSTVTTPSVSTASTPPTVVSTTLSTTGTTSPTDEAAANKIQVGSVFGMGAAAAVALLI